MKQHSTRSFLAYILYAITFVVCLSSCKSYKLITYESDYCEPPIYANIVEKPIEFNSDSILVPDHKWKTQFTKQNVLLAHALNLDKELEQLTELKDEHSNIKDSVLYLAAQQKIEQKVRDALVEIDALVGELDCEGERCDQLKELLEGMNSKRDNKLTVASIVIGALSAVADACISNDGWNKGVAIGAGVIGAGLGWATLSPKGKRLILKHKRNHLRAVWEEKNSNEFPPIVWYMLNEIKFTNTQQSTMLKNIRKRWLTFTFEDDIKEANKSSLFKNEGVYTESMLETRSQIVGQLKATTQTLNQNFSSLLKEIKQL
jgi:lipoprotein